jgi:transcriptional regulator with XRE-family HTH domain
MQLLAVMKLETRIFELCPAKYRNLSDLARAMGISVSQIYRVRQGKRPVSQKFITGTIKAFPGYKLDDLFYVVPDIKQNDHG